MAMSLQPLQLPVTNRSPTEPVDLSVPRPANSQHQTPEDMALHRAVERHDVTAIADLMKNGASPAVLDSNGLTPVHLCIVKKFIKPFTILLSYEGSANVLDASGLSVLCVAVLHIWREGVSAAITEGTKVTVKEFPVIPESVITQRYPEAMLSTFGSKFYEDTIIHLAAKSGEIEIIDKIAAAVNYTIGASINCLNKRGVTPLYAAIESGVLEAVQILIRRGAHVNKVSNQNDTALHIAVHHPHILKYLLNETGVKNCLNEQGSAPIHLAVGINKVQSVELLLSFKQQHIEPSLKLRTEYKDESLFQEVIEPVDTCMQLMSAKPKHILYDCDPRAALPLSHELRYPFKRVKTLTQILSLDGDGYSPLHIAAKQRNMSMITLLLRKGAKLSTKGAKGRTALEIIATEFYNPSKCFELIFDDFIATKQVVSDTVVKVDYNALTTTDGVSQMKVIEDLIRCGQRKTLIHPMVESLLYLKWKHLLPVFFALIGIYTTFLITFNIFAINVIYYRDKNKSSFNASVPSNSEIAWLKLFDRWYWLLITLIYTSIALLLLQELFNMYLRKLRYFLTLETWVKLTCFALSSIVPIAESISVQPYWHHHATSTALLLTWLQTMFLVSRFPKWGYYVLIFGKVTVNVFKILLTSICLIIGFSFCFMIEVQCTPPFDDPLAAFVKTVVMMSAELDYEALFDKDHRRELQDMSVLRLFFVLFVIFVAIILMNFMIGVAVSDINDLEMTGNINRLEKQVELLSSLEVLINNPLFANLYTKLFGNKKYHTRLSNYVGFQSKWYAILSADFDFYCLDLPSALHDAIVDIAWKKDQRNAKNSIVVTNTYKLNALYNAIVHKPLVVEAISGEGEVNSEKKTLRKEKSRLSVEIDLLNERLLLVNNNFNKAMIDLNQIISDTMTIKEILARHRFNEHSVNKHPSISLRCQTGLRKNSL